MQHGPGAENSFGGVAQCYSESVPVLVLPAGYGRRTMHVDPNYSSMLNLRHVTKLSDVLLAGAHTPEVLRRAFSALRNGRPRPVSVEIPVDVFGEDVPEPLDYTPTFATRSGPDPADVSRVAEVIANAERPVLYVGQGVHYARAWAELRELAELLDIPVTASLEGKSAFPEDHPLYLGCGGRSMPKAVRTFLDEADVVIGMGVSFTRTGFGVRMPGGGPGSGKTFVHCTLDPADLQKELPADHALIGDAQLTLQALLAELKGRPRSAAAEARSNGAVAARIATVNDAWWQEWQSRLTSDATPIDPYRVIGELGNVLDAGECIVTHDAGSPRDQLTPFWRATEPLSYLGWGKTTQLGYGLGLAMGAKLARPDKICVNVWGDAAIGFTGMDFETAVRERIPILSILLNNFSMAIELPIMKAAQEKYGSCDISGDYAAFARALGGYGERVTEPGEVAAAIRRGVEQTRDGTPVLLEFITAKDHTYSVF
jgi:acetolactate synthase-1/2/3 large subunit